MEQKPTPEIAGLLTPEEYEIVLARNEDDPRLRALRERLGDAAGIAVAILAHENDGRATYVVVGGENYGDSIRDYEAHGLPEPSAMASELQAQAVASEQADSGIEQSGEFVAFNETLIGHLNATKPAIDFVDAAIETSRITARALGNIEDSWRQMKSFDNVNEAGVSDLVGNLYEVRERIANEQEPTATTMRQLDELRDEIEAMKRETVLEATQDLHERDKAWYALRKTEEALQEVIVQLRTTNFMRDDIADRVNSVTMQLDQMLQDSWGREAYEARISGILDELASEPSLQPYVPLSRAQAELEDITRIKEKLISKEW